MIGKLTGRLEVAGDGEALIDVGGVGYVVHCSARTLAAMTAGAMVSLLVETQVRQDAITLFGFATAEEKRWFRLLTAVQGVGAKAALAVLSAVPPVDLAVAVAAGDRAVVSRANGVGPKLASRIVAELKDKVSILASDGAGGAPTGAAPPAAGPRADAVSAIVNLGFRPADALTAVDRVAARLGADADVGALIRQALADLAPAETA